MHLIGYDIDLWLIIGFAGQFLFFMRFVVQWIATERAKRTVLPISFWYFSIGGSAILLIYSIKREDPVFVLGSILAMMIYSRNLYFARRTAASESLTP